MNIPANILEKNIEELFGFADMTDGEKAALLNDVGAAILESAVLKYIATIEKSDAEAFEKFIEEHADDENVFTKLIQAFPDFAAVLEAEITAFKKEAIDVLSV